jgi:hypothetical protein
MSTFPRFFAVFAALVLSSSLFSAWSFAQDLPTPPIPSRLAHRSIVAERPPAPVNQAREQPAAEAEADSQDTLYYVLPSDPYGFSRILNAYRASAGLPPVAYDPNLSAWASQNNAAQSRKGIGHHVNPGCFQNCGWNYASAWDVANGWLHSPGHRANMLQPGITRFGIAYGPGPYWTLNVR